MYYLRYRTGENDPEALNNIHQCPINIKLDEVPTVDELSKAIASLKDGKASGEDGIPAEVWKHGGKNLSGKLHELICKAWEEGSVPQAWKDDSVWELQGNLPPFHCRKSLCKNPP